MGDRCWMQITMAVADLDRFGEILNAAKGRPWWDDEGMERKTEGGVERGSFIIEEANYALDSELREAAEAGIVFFDEHASGGDYGAGIFAGHGGQYLCENAGEHGLPCVNIGVDGCAIPVQVAQARAYLKLRRAAEAALGVPEDEQTPEMVSNEDSCDTWRETAIRLAEMVRCVMGNRDGGEDFDEALQNLSREANEVLGIAED